MSMVTSDETTPSTRSLVDEALASIQTEPFLSKPSDHDYIYPISSFPPLSTFDISIAYPALVVPARQIPDLRKKLSHVLLNRPKLKVVYPLEDDDPVPSSDLDRSKFRKMILADQPDLFEDPHIQELIQDQPDSFCRASHKVTMGYEDWTVEQVLRRILPVKEVPSAFEIIGHLAHMNLRDETLPYKYIVGKVILDKNVRIKTVVNKVGQVDTKFRTFGMEVIAGDEGEGWSEVTVREEGCQYQLDFTKVYWNSRLGGEHRRLVEMIHKEASKSESDIVVADLMAGIGPFAVPLTSKGIEKIHVHANDLNPSSYEYLVRNSKKNKCKNLSCYNMDARAFCHMLQDKKIDFQQVLMNLPATAPEFLDAFRGFSGKTLPRIHVHCFSKKEADEAERETIARCARALGVPLEITISNVIVHMVRNVAPKKNMYCVSFDLPETVRALPRIELDSDANPPEDEPEAKRQKVEDKDR